jgi:hypothetical protein
MKFGPPLFWLGVSLWVGGLAAMAIAAPTIFRTAPDRATAGAIFGNILRAFSRVEIVCALLAAAGMALSWQRPTPPVDWMRAVLLLFMIAVLIAMQVWIRPALDALLPGVGENPVEQFQRLHRVSEFLYKGSVIAGLALILSSAWTSRRPA